MIDEVPNSVFAKIHEQTSYHWVEKQDGCRYDLFLLHYAEGKLPNLRINQKDGRNFEPFILSIQCFPESGTNPLEQIKNNVRSTAKVVIELLQREDSDNTGKHQLVGMRVGGDLLDFMTQCKQNGFVPAIMGEAAEKLNALMFSNLPNAEAARARIMGKAQIRWGQIKVYGQS